MFRYYARLALRRCSKGPAMVVLVVLTMAVGIASCMTSLTIFRALAGDPLPGISSHLYVVTMDARTAADNDRADYHKPVSYLQWTDAHALVAARRAKQQVALAQASARIGTTAGKSAREARGLMVDGDPVGMFGIPLRYGRAWTVAEQAAQEPVLVIDSDLAEKLFGSADVVGRSVQLGQRSFRVIGVTAPWRPRTVFLDLPRNVGSVLGANEQFFVPVRAALQAGVGPLTSGRCGKHAPVVTFQSAHVGSCRWLEAWVALQTPAELTAYRHFLKGYADVQHSSGRFAYPPQARLYGTQAWMAIHHVVPNDVHLNVLLAGAFLLLCMINVAGLLAARFLRRRGDVAIRRALGASRRDVLLQHLVETGVMGLLGGALALPLTGLGLWIVRMQPVAYAEAAHLSVGAFVILLLLSLAVGLLVGVLPAWRVCRQSPALQIKLA